MREKTYCSAALKWQAGLPKLTQKKLQAFPVDVG
jgi:hypothetical protein